MTQQAKTRRRVKPGLAVTCGNCIPPQPEEDDPWYAPYYLQLAQSLNLHRFGHPEIATRITFRADYGGADVLWQLCRRVASGQRFAPGDRVQIRTGVWKDDRTVVFIPHATEYGPCLLAVVEGVEEAFQQLCYADAAARIAAHPNPIEPYAWE